MEALIYSAFLFFRDMFMRFYPVFGGVKHEIRGFLYFAFSLLYSSLLDQILRSCKLFRKRLDFLPKMGYAILALKNNEC